MIKWFWNYNGFNKDVIKSTERIYKIVTYTQKGMVLTSFLVMYAYFIRPIFDPSHIFLLETSVPKSEAIDAVIMIAQMYNFSVAIPIVLGYDLIYFALCVHVILQTKLLKNKIKGILNMGRNSDTHGIIKCVEYHKFLYS